MSAWGSSFFRATKKRKSHGVRICLAYKVAGWRTAKLCDRAIGRKAVLPEFPASLHQVAAQAVTAKELAARIGAGAH